MSARDDEWPLCGVALTPDDPTGCRGIALPGLTECLAHADSAGVTAYLSTLHPGATLDFRATTISEILLSSILLQLTPAETSTPIIGELNFSLAKFEGRARFSGVRFDGPARFDSALFAHEAHFDDALFTHDAAFDSARFERDAHFESVTFALEAGFRGVEFKGNAWFTEAHFNEIVSFQAARINGDALFPHAHFEGRTNFFSATFSGHASFNFARFSDDTVFGGSTFKESAHFDSSIFSESVEFNHIRVAKRITFNSTTLGAASFEWASFEEAQHIGPLVCADQLSFHGAKFTGPSLLLEAACGRLSCGRSIFAGTTIFRLRYAEVTLSEAIIESEMIIQARHAEFADPEFMPIDDSSLEDLHGSAAVRLVHLDGIDAANVVLTDIDLSDCLFTGAIHLDQIRLGFGCTFPQPPSGWHLGAGVLPAHWSRRKTVSEEHHWRASLSRRGSEDWRRSRYYQPRAFMPGPDDLLGVYQQLRKAFEDAGNEPDAADFYYGEMEMRRHDQGRPRAERILLWFYWAVSGYGLRASRAIFCLLFAMAATVLVLLLVGLPNTDPVPQTDGTSRAGSVHLATSTPDPRLTLPLGERFSRARVDKATLVVVNSVVFRSGGQNLTTPGTVTEMVSRIGEPVLLGLAALAVRGRVKR